MRYLSIDLGDKRTGLALGDSITNLTSPLKLIEIDINHADGETLLRALDDAWRDEAGTDAAIVMGLPLNADGTESPRSKLVRAFAKRLGERTGAEVILHDERRSSMAADEKMARSGLTHAQKKRRRDAIAAAAILQSYLDEQR
ncbi:MAG: Holliday junction resolvase RuvX [Planctomycetota bacterium]